MGVERKSPISHPRIHLNTSSISTVHEEVYCCVQVISSHDVSRIQINWTSKFMPVGIGWSCFWILWKPAKTLPTGKGGFSGQVAGWLFWNVFMSWKDCHLPLLTWWNSEKHTLVGISLLWKSRWTHHPTHPQTHHNHAIYPLLTWTLVHLGTPNCDVYNPFAHSLTFFVPRDGLYSNQNGVRENDTSTNALLRVPRQCQWQRWKDNYEWSEWWPGVVRIKRRIAMIETWQHSWLPYMPTSQFLLNLASYVFGNPSDGGIRSHESPQKNMHTKPTFRGCLGPGPKNHGSFSRWPMGRCFTKSIRECTQGTNHYDWNKMSECQKAVTLLSFHHSFRY